MISDAYVAELAPVREHTHPDGAASRLVFGSVGRDLYDALVQTRRLLDEVPELVFPIVMRFATELHADNAGDLARCVQDHLREKLFEELSR